MFSLPAMRELSVAASSIEGSTLNAARVGQNEARSFLETYAPYVALKLSQARALRDERLAELTRDAN